MTNRSPSNPYWQKYVSEQYGISNPVCCFDDSIKILAGLGLYSPNVTTQDFSNVYGLTYPWNDSTEIAYRKMYNDWKAAVIAFSDYAWKLIASNPAMRGWSNQNEYQRIMSERVANFTQGFIDGLKKNPSTNFAMQVMTDLVNSQYQYDKNNPAYIFDVPVFNTTISPAQSGAKTRDTSSSDSTQQDTTDQNNSTATNYTPLLLMGGIAAAIMMFKKK